MTTSGRPQERRAFAVLAAATLVYAMSLALVVPVIPQVKANLGTTQVGATWVLTIFLILSAALTPVVGRIGDVTGRKRALIVSMVISAAGLAITAVATNLAWALVGRAIQGLGGGMIPLTFGLARDELPDRRVPAAVSALSASTAVGSAGGVVCAGPIVENLGYAWLFWLPCVGMLAVAVLAWFTLRPSAAHPGQPIGWGSGALLAGWLMVLLLVITQGPAWGWASPQVAVLGLVAVAGCVVWTWRELRSPAPVVDLRVLASRRVGPINVVAFLVGWSMFASMAFTTQFTQTSPSHGYGFGLSLTAAGLMQLPTSGSGFVAGMAISRLVRWVQVRVLCMWSCALLALGLLGMGWWPDSLWHIAVFNALTGLGLGGAASCQAIMLSTSVPPHQTGVANGVSITVRTIGGTMGTALVGTLLAASMGAGERVPQAHGYTTGFSVLALGAAVAFIVAWRSSGQRPRRSND